MRRYLYRLKDYAVKQYIRFLLRNKQAYFIVSTGRTGTKFLETFLNSASEAIYCVHEPQPDLFDVSVRKVRYNIPAEIIVKEIIKARKKEIRKFYRTGKVTYVESNPFLAFLLPEVKRAFPAAKFLVIYREPGSYLTSALQKSPLNDGRNNFYAETDGRARISAKDFPGDPFFDSWDTMSRSQKIAWYWSKCNQELMDFVNENPDTVIELGFERFFNAQEGERRKNISRLLTFFDIKADNDKMDMLCALMNRKVNGSNAIREDAGREAEKLLEEKNIRTVISKDVLEKIKIINYG